MKKYLLSTVLITATIMASPCVLSDMVKQDSGKKSDDKGLKMNDSSALSNTQKKETDEAIDTQKNKEKEKLDIINESVLEGFKKIDEATTILLDKKGNEKAAIKALEVATGKFDVALANDPNLALVPIEAGIFANELQTTPEDIRVSIKLAIDLLEDNKVRDARLLLTPMLDELVISTTYLPMNTYPDAIKKATKELIDGKKEDAIETLDVALSTLVTKQSIIPLGVIRAENLVKTASNMDKEKDKDTIKKYLKDAENQLQISILLGYADKHSQAYNDLESQIKTLRKEVKGKNIVEKLYDKLKASFSQLIGEHSESKQVTQQQPVHSSNDSTPK